MEAKQRLVRQLLDQVKPRTVWDLGVNDGRFSRIAAQSGAETVIAWDVDPACVEKNYQEACTRHELAMHPLLLDLTNPTPGIGWANLERKSFAGADLPIYCCALGLVHHLSIGNNTPLSQIAQYFSSLAKWVIVEWIPKDDSQVQRLLSSREDIFCELFQCSSKTIFAGTLCLSKKRQFHRPIGRCTYSRHGRGRNRHEHRLHELQEHDAGARVAHDWAAINKRAASVFIVIHPFLLCCAYFVSVFAKFKQGKRSDCVDFFLRRLHGTGVVLFCARLWQKSLVKAALVTSLFNLLFYSYGWIFDFVMQHEPIKLSYDSWHVILLAAGAAILFTVGTLVRQTNLRLEQFSQFLSGALTIFLVIARLLSGDKNGI